MNLYKQKKKTANLQLPFAIPRRGKKKKKRDARSRVNRKKKKERTKTLSRPPPVAS